MNMLKSSQARTVFSFLLSWYLKITFKLQFGLRLEGAQNLSLMAGDKPVIIAFWHEALPLAPVLWRAAGKLGMKRPAVALMSRHRDGRMIGSILQRFGIGMVSGSSSKGGVAGTRELTKSLQNGFNIGLTPDGPRGPARSAAAGVAALAGISGALILPCGIATTRFFVIKKSWDKMRVPLPFGRMVLVCNTPISVPRESWREALPGIEVAISNAQKQAML